MDGQPAASGTARPGVSRLVSFVDAVTAIAMTLLILPLVDEASGIGTQSPGAFLEENAYGLFAFALSFVVIFRFWLGHHRMYEGVTGYTPGLVWLNMLWLLGIVFLPFPTELLDSAGQESPLANGLYIGTLCWISGAGLVQQLIISRTPGLRDPAAGTVSLLSAGVRTALMFAALALSVLLPRVGLWALLLLFLQAPLLGLQGRLRRGDDRK